MFGHPSSLFAAAACLAAYSPILPFSSSFPPSSPVITTVPSTASPLLPSTPPQQPTTQHLTQSTHHHDSLAAPCGSPPPPTTTTSHLPPPRPRVFNRETHYTLEHTSIPSLTTALASSPCDRGLPPSRAHPHPPLTASRWLPPWLPAIQARPRPCNCIRAPVVLLLRQATRLLPSSGPPRSSWWP